MHKKMQLTVALWAANSHEYFVAYFFGERGIVMRVEALQCLFVSLFLVILCSPAMAQWVTQTVELDAGWNAVFLEVEPYPPRCEDLLEGSPIKAVWFCDQHFSSMQFIRSPDELVPESPDWRCYFTSDRTESLANNLFLLQAGKAYIVYSEQAFTWNIKGQPVFVEYEWKPNAFSLQGFYVDPSDPPTLQEWFATSKAHTPLNVWELGGDENWHQVVDPGATSIISGRPYWVSTIGSSDYQGPVEIEPPPGGVLDYGRFLPEQELRVRHDGTVEREIVFLTLPSEAAPMPIEGEIAPVVGPVSLLYDGFAIYDGTAAFKHYPLPVTLNYPQGDRRIQELPLAVKRRDMPASSSDDRFQSLLVVEDGQGFRRTLGVTSEGRVTAQAGGALSRLAEVPGLVPDDRGLWIGYATIDKVTEPKAPETDMTDTDTDFSFRLILHVDRHGDIRFLNEVTLMFHEPTDSSSGEYVLMTPPIPQALENAIATGIVKPGSLKDGRPFGKRVSTPMFSLLDEDGNPEETLGTLAGTFGDGGTLTISLLLEDTDPHNPFHHQYHPYGHLR